MDRLHEASQQSSVFGKR